MPYCTQGYPFEWKVLHFAEDLSKRLVGGTRGAFVIVFDDKGAARTLHFEFAGKPLVDLMQHLEAAGKSHLFFDPFDAPEYTWMSWHHVGRATMERLVDAPFAEIDFVKTEYAQKRAKDLVPPSAFPTSWSVMF